MDSAAAEIKLRAERKLGDALAGMEKNVGGRPSKTSDTMSPVSLEDLDITKKQSSRWQKVAYNDLRVTPCHSGIAAKTADLKRGEIGNGRKVDASKDASTIDEPASEHRGTVGKAQAG